MNSGDSVQDATRSGPDEASGFGAAGEGAPTRSPGTQKPLQDIQDLIDKLAAVTQQLRHPGSMAGPSNLDTVKLDTVATQQPHAVRLTERGGAQQRERPDVAGDVLLALQVDAAR